MNVDFETFENPDVVCDLGSARWPWDHSSVDEAKASHILEHLPGETFFHFLRELYRVMKPGAPVHIALPHPRHDIFLQDPTHCRPVLPGTMLLFSRSYIDGMEREGKKLTDFGRRNGIDFHLDSKIRYNVDPSFDTSAPDFEWQCKHLANVIVEWTGTMRAVK